MANLNGGDSSIVITTDSQPPYTHEPAGDPESCNGKIDPGSFVDRASSNGPSGLGDEVKSLGLSKQRVEGETNTKLLSDVKEKQQTIAGVGQNGPSNLDQGIEAAISVNDLPSATATTTDPDLNHNKDDYTVPSLGDCGQDTKELNEYPGESEKDFDLDQSADHTDNFVFIAICPKRETETVGEPVESVQNVQGSTREEFQQEVSPLTENSNANIEVCDPEIEDPINVADQSREHEIELASSPQAESLVVHIVEVIKSETDLVSAVCGNLEDFIPSPMSSERSEILLSTISRSEFELGIADSREVLNFHVDDAKSEVGCLDVEGGDMHSVPSDAEVKLEIEDTNSSVTDSQEIPQNTAFTFQTEISDNSIDTVGKLVESVKNIKESTGEDEFQPWASPLTENSNANTGEVCNRETEDPINIVVQSMEKFPETPREHEIELEESPRTKSLVVNTDEVIKPETDVVSGNPEAVISSPINSERLETVLSKDVNGNELGDSIHGCSANTTISEAEFEHGIADSREVLNFKVDDLQDVTEVVVLDVECADKHSVPSDAVVKVEAAGMNSSGIGCQDMPCNSALVSQTEVSDSSIVTGENVPNSVPEMKDVEDQGDQLPVLTEVGILDVEFADTLSVPSDAEVKLQANNMKSFGKGSEGLPCNSTFASQTKVSDSSTVTDEIVSNSVPEVTDVEDQGDQLPVLTEVGILDVECADTHDAEVKLEPNDMKSPGIGSKGMPCKSVLASQTQVSDISVVTGDNVPNSVPEMKDVENQGDQLPVLTEVGILDIECADSHSEPSDVEVKLEANDMNSSDLGSQDLPCNSTLASESEISDSSFITGENVPNSVPEMKDVEDQGDRLPVLDVKSDDKIIGQKSEDLERSHSNENSIADTLAGQDVVITPITRPFQFLFRIPRFDDPKVRDEITHAELKVDEKTDYRDAFRPEIKKHRAILNGHTDEYEDAMSKARSSKKSVKTKRAEIESLQAVINKVKNAISVDDIDARIYSMEHMIQHETLPLKEEKQFIREIKQLKQLREQLSSNIGSQDEVQQAFSKREEIEERLKILKKELDSLKDSVLKAEAVARAAEKKYEDESKKLKELLSQFGDADDIRQSAYKHLGSLRKELFEKNEHFRMYKKTAAAASNYAASKDREALYHLCRNQVETFMDLWNKNDEFRKEYVKCNVRSTVRRLGTLDGRSLGPHEEPPVLTSYVVERINQFVSKPANTCSVLQTPILKEENQVKPVKEGFADNNTEVTEREGKSQTTKNGESVKPTLGNGPATFSGRGMNDEMSEMEHIPTKEELALARKVEELKKVESAAKLREQRRLEEKSKALEALERKKRIAEKAQIRAELRAQKEAEQREKEREKRLRKKERKKATGAEVPDLDNSGESTPRSEILTETMKEPEDKDTFTSAPKKPQKSSFFFKQSKTKSIPPPLRNRSKRKMQQWMWVIITCMLVICLFVLGNVGFFSNLSNLRQRSYSF